MKSPQRSENELTADSELTNAEASESRDVLLDIEADVGQMKAILDNLGDAISIQNPDLRIVWQNRRDREDCGDLIGR